MKLIDKDVLVAEIERLRKEDGNPYFTSETAYKYYARGVHFTCDGLVNFLDTLEVKEINLTDEINFYIKSSLTGTNPIYTKGGVSCIIEKTAKHFFELGLKVQKGE